MEPIIKWVGGKRWLAPRITPLIRKHLKGNYYEPFMGSASVFLAVQPTGKSYLYDSVDALVAAFLVIKREPMGVWSYLRRLRKTPNTQQAYNQHRSYFNGKLEHGQFDAEFAAYFLYLNRTGYNGLWRQNANGDYNVPFGDYSKVRLPSISELIAFSKCTQNASIRGITSPDDTLTVIRRTEPGDVIFSDPPYLNTYQGYDGIFEAGYDYQSDLAIALWKSARRGVKVFATNIDCKETRGWYGAFCKIHTFKRAQSIAGTTQGRKQWNQILAVSQ